ncbi:membrane protein insertase YidC [Candidatus Schneideria nysicola]|uniref:membrane protein insertase YidC n=1 Tax=Candidatus Schneideria nysicola TaxID=1081631 RepID=UPI001CAA5B8E|nr:membrane protein insertase YidC [Candidatus Schneideria nysicola]UAJ65327.1 membrane protein insertase YidC [Candidatus Schneideria nysicola]
MSPISYIVIGLIRLYQFIFSPLLKSCCLFRPTCSQYGIEAIRQFGILIGILLILKRISKCHPFYFHYRSYRVEDPVPQRFFKKRILIMDSQRNILVIAFLFISFVIWQIWEMEHTMFKTEEITTQENIQQDNSTKIFPKNNITINNSTTDNYNIKVITDVLSLDINRYGGNIENADLLTYSETLGSNKPFRLLETSDKFIYQIQSGLITKSENPLDYYKIAPLYFSPKQIYILKEGENELYVPMMLLTKEGIQYTKTFILKRNNFSICIEHTINNNSNSPIELSLFGQIIQSIVNPSINVKNSFFTFNTYRGAAYSSEYTKYKKYSFEDIQNKNLNLQTQKGWIAMLQEYFVTALILPFIPGIKTIYTANFNNSQAVIGYLSPILKIEPKSSKNIQSTLWIGPEIQEKMASVASNLDLTVDYGWLWFIAQPLFKLLQLIHFYVNNWGLSIIIITLIIKIIMYPLTKSQYISMEKMKKLQPKIIKLRERFSHDKQRQSQEILDLYKDEKINPLSGCLPLFIQMPIFLALYYMLSNSIELRHAPFTLWIYDLSSYDPYYILPILMGLTMFIIQKISPNRIMDTMQKRIMDFIPIIFIFLFLWFPSGLVLYYVVSNVFTIIQQPLIYRSLKKLDNIEKK